MQAKVATCELVGKRLDVAVIMASTTDTEESAMSLGPRRWGVPGSLTLIVRRGGTSSEQS